MTNIYIVTDLIKALPSNCSVNSPNMQQYMGNCFLCGLRQATIEQRGYAIRF
jgi:hypothetical protein